MDNFIGAMAPAERAVYQLRSLYEGMGYRKFRMSRFEEYDLYLENRSFLQTDGIVTFTGPSGRLMALKPDVTLSIMKSMRGEKGSHGSILPPTFS